MALMQLPSINRRASAGRGMVKTVTLDSGMGKPSRLTASSSESRLPIRTASLGSGLARQTAASLLMRDMTERQVERISSKDRAARGGSKEKAAGSAAAEAAPDAAGSTAAAAAKEPETVSIRALKLSKKHRLEFFEVKDVLEALDKAEKTRSGSIDQDAFAKFLSRVFEADDVPNDIVVQLHRTTCKDSKGVETEFDLDAFLAWYMMNIFTTVAKLRGDRKAIQSAELTKQLCDKYGLFPSDLDKIKKKFDQYDSDGSGQIDESEFVDMIMRFVGAGKGDLSKERLKNFWREIDRDGSGEVDFQEFVVWYLKYFGDADASGPTESFYSSFCPSAQRQKHLGSLEAADLDED